MDVRWQHVFGERLRDLRLQRHWTQERLAEQVDVSVATVTRWERGKAHPQPEQRQRICDVFGPDGHALFHGHDPTPSPGQPHTYLGAADSLHAVPVSLDDTPFWNVAPVRELRLGDPALKQGRQPVAGYFERACFARARAALRDAVRQGTGGIALFGAPMVGKTRMALEALRHEAPDFLLVPWPRQEVALAALDRFAGRRVTLLLDDLHELTHQQEAGRILAAVRRLLSIAGGLLVVVTSRAGADEAATRQHYDGLIESLGLVTLRVPPMAGEESEAADFLAFVRALAEREPTRRFAVDAFDGTPGSILLGLERRTSQLRSPRFHSAAKAILKALALLRAAGVYEFAESRVRRVAEAVFELPASQWSDALDYLVGGGWISLDEGDQRGESRLYLPTDAYLDVCLPESGVYPRSNRRITSDFPKVHEALVRAPVDSPALFALSRAIFSARREIATKWNELGVQAARAGLAPLDPLREPLLWARGQFALGISYWKRWEGDLAQNMVHAIAALEAAQTVLTREAHPAEWAALQRALGAAYIDPALGPQDELLERGIACLHAALQVHTRDVFPYDWGRAHNALGVAYQRRVRGERAENIERAIEHFTQAAQTLTRQAYPDAWALVMRNLGEAYAQRECGDRIANHERAIACCRAVLDDAMREAFPYDWARTHVVLAGIHAAGRGEERLAHLRSAITHYGAALDVLTPGDYAADRAKALDALQAVREQLAEEVRAAVAPRVAPSPADDEQDAPE